jgi:hypothetical protein
MLVKLTPELTMIVPTNVKLFVNYNAIHKMHAKSASGNSDIFTLIYYCLFMHFSSCALKFLLFLQVIVDKIVVGKRMCKWHMATHFS